MPGSSSKFALTKHPLIGEVPHHKPHPSREETNKYVEVKEERGPGCGLVLTNTGNDGNMDLGIAAVR